MKRKQHVQFLMLVLGEGLRLRYGTPEEDGLAQRMFGEVFAQAGVKASSRGARGRANWQVDVRPQVGSQRNSGAGRRLEIHLAKLQGECYSHGIHVRASFSASQASGHESRELLVADRMELYNNYLVDLLRPIDWQGAGRGGPPRAAAGGLGLASLLCSRSTEPGLELEVGQVRHGAGTERERREPTLKQRQRTNETRKGEEHREPHMHALCPTTFLAREWRDGNCANPRGSLKGSASFFDRLATRVHTGCRHFVSHRLSRNHR